MKESLRFQVTKLFRNKKSQTAGFELDVKGDLPPGITMLFGHSGSGKTTLLNCIAGPAQPDRGEIEAGGELWFDSAKRVNRPTRKRGVGYQMQDLALFPHLNAEENIRYGIDELPGSEQRERVERACEAFRIG